MYVLCLNFMISDVCLQVWEKFKCTIVDTEHFQFISETCMLSIMTSILCQTPVIGVEVI